MMDGVGDRRLVAAAAHGDERAFAALYDLHVEPIFLQALAELGSEDDAQEVTQEVFAIAWRKLKKIYLVNESALPWLLTTCSNVTANRLRSIRRRPVTEDLDAVRPTLANAETIDDQFYTHHLVDRVEREVDTMPPLDQSVYWAIIREERTYEDTAASLDISVASVRKRLNRVRLRLREKFGDEL
jgi:RNA polymerase sigma factor (sigma-70 family)